MKHIAAYLLLGLGGYESPSADDVKGVLSSVGIEADEDKLAKLLSSLKGKSLEDVINTGRSKLGSLPAGGGGGGGAAAAPAAGGAKAEEKKEEAKKDEPKEESDEDMGFSLFD